MPGGTWKASRVDVGSWKEAVHSVPAPWFSQGIDFVVEVGEEALTKRDIVAVLFVFLLVPPEPVDTLWMVGRPPWS